MAELRYVGTSNWERTVVDDDGKFVRSVRTQPGEVVDMGDDEAVGKILSAPRHHRNFVAVNGPEDRYGKQFQPNRYEAVRGNATPFPELDMGSTVVSNRTITRTEDDNEEGFRLADAHEGPASDNAELILKDEAEQAAREALEKKRTEQQSRRPASGGQGGAGVTKKPGS